MRILEKERRVPGFLECLWHGWLLCVSADIFNLVVDK